jgi:uncharacterized membrane protein
MLRDDVFLITIEWRLLLYGIVFIVVVKCYQRLHSVYERKEEIYEYISQPCKLIVIANMSCLSPHLFRGETT